MELTLEEFQERQEELESIVLYPGTLDELNILMDENNVRYGLHPLLRKTKGRKFIVGLIIPTIGELLISSKFTTAKETEEISDEEIWLSYKKREGAIIDRMLRAGDELFEYEIRNHAKIYGADGLIHVRPYSGDIFMGVPVKREIDTFRDSM